MNKILNVSLIGLVFFSHGAAANKIKKFSINAPEGYENAPVINVYSTNGERWDAIDKTKETTFSLELRAECKYEGKGNKAYRGDLKVDGFEQVGKEEPANIYIPYAKKTEAKFRYQSKPVFSAVEACNIELKKRVSENSNKTKYHILGQGFTINYPAAYKATYKLSCNATGLGRSTFRTKAKKVNAKIQCQSSDLAKSKIPPKEIKKVVLIPLIKNVSFKAKQKHLVGKCPMLAKFGGEIRASRAGVIEYQYISHDNKKSPKLKLKFDKAGSKSLRVWNRTINKDKNKLKRKASNNEYDYQGWYKLVILSPKGQKEIQANYTLTCLSKKNIIKIK